MKEEISKSTTSTLYDPQVELRPSAESFSLYILVKLFEIETDHLSLS